MKQVYLCGPILTETDEEANTWRRKAIKELDSFECLDPMRRQFSDEDLLGTNEIVQMDLEDVKNSDVILVNYNKARPETEFVGTSMEVRDAWRAGKYIVVFSNKTKKQMSPWMIFNSTRIVKSLDEAITYIKKHF